MTTPLQLAEAVPLGYAVLAQVADDVGVRMLAIKGPILAMQGLRHPRQSADIDVLVDPAGFTRLTEGLERVGWVDLGDYAVPGLVPRHAINHRHPSWPCAVDVHHWFPGFLADPASSFEVFWSRRTAVRVAGRDILALDAVAHAALAALHYLRDEGRALRAADIDALVRVIDTTWDASQKADLAKLAAATGASEPLRPLLTRLNLEVLPETQPLAVSLEEWRMRSEASVTEVLPWLVELGRLPWRRRPGFLRGALWPATETLHWVDPSHPLRGRELAAFRWQRMRRAIQALPAAMVEQRRLRKRRK